jgi:hypothetical protein
MAFDSDNVFTYMKKREHLARTLKEASVAVGDYVNELNLFMRKVEEARAISDFFMSNPNFSLASMLSDHASSELKEKIKNLESKDQSKVKALEEFYEIITKEINGVNFSGYKLADNYEELFPEIMAAFCKKQGLASDQIDIWKNSYNSLYISDRLGGDLLKFLEKDFTGLDKFIVSDEVSYHPNVKINEVISGILHALSVKDELIPIDDSSIGFITKKVDEAKNALKNNFSNAKKELEERYEKHLNMMKSNERKQKAIEMNVSIKDKVNSITVPIGIN